MSTLKLSALEWNKWKPGTDLLAVFAFQEEDGPRLLGLGKESQALAEAAKTDGFSGKERETLLLRLPEPSPAKRLFLVGLGKESEFNPETLRRAVSKVLRGAEHLKLKTIAVRAPEASTVLEAEAIQAMGEGFFLAHYRFDRHQNTPVDASKPIEGVELYFSTLSPSTQQLLERAQVYSDATLLARDLINEPPSRMNPERLAQEASKLRSAAVSVKVYETKDLEKMGMGAILGVGAGGQVPPRLVELIYKPGKNAKKIVALVGKGITFDSGGLSLKPAQSMETMKDDMSGAASVVGVFSALAKLKPPVEVRGYLAIAENMPGGRAQKPGDVVKSFNGKTIEVLNTDAEGRLVLADALSYAASLKPDLIIDIATLTGACVVALGHLITGLMTNTPELAEALLAAAEKSGEKFWQLPLLKEYAQDIKSKIADLKNIGGRRGEAGTLIGGLFLQEFVGSVPWVHLDIAGPSWTDSDQPYCPTGGTGHPVRTLLHYLEDLNG